MFMLLHLHTEHCSATIGNDMAQNDGYEAHRDDKEPKRDSYMYLQRSLQGKNTTVLSSEYVPSLFVLGKFSTKPNFKVKCYR